jgi:hypothetical protein
MYFLGSRLTNKHTIILWGLGLGLELELELELELDPQRED